MRKKRDDNWRFKYLTAKFFREKREEDPELFKEAMKEMPKLGREAVSMTDEEFYALQARSEREGEQNAREADKRNKKWWDSLTAEEQRLSEVRHQFYEETAAIENKVFKIYWQLNDEAPDDDTHFLELCDLLADQSEIPGLRQKWIDVVRKYKDLLESN